MEWTYQPYKAQDVGTSDLAAVGAGWRLIRGSGADACQLKALTLKRHDSFWRIQLNNDVGWASLDWDS